MQRRAILAGPSFELKVLESGNGFYIGTTDKIGTPNSRESKEYWRKETDAAAALASGNWTQRARS